MAANQILLTVYRDKNAPFDPSSGVQKYNPPQGRSFYVGGIKGVRNVTESSVTYGCITYHETDGAPREDILVTQASGTIIGLTNA